MEKFIKRLKRSVKKVMKTNVMRKIVNCKNAYTSPDTSNDRIV